MRQLPRHPSLVVLLAAALPACSSNGGATFPPPGHAANGSVNAGPKCPACPTVHTGVGTYYDFADGSSSRQRTDLVAR